MVHCGILNGNVLYRKVWFGMAWHGLVPQQTLIHRDPAAGKTECSFKQQTLGRRRLVAKTINFQRILVSQWRVVEGDEICVAN